MTRSGIPALGFGRLSTATRVNEILHPPHLPGGEFSQQIRKKSVNGGGASTEETPLGQMQRKFQMLKVRHADCAWVGEEHLKI